MKKLHQSINGFTAIELLVAILILVVIGSAAYFVMKHETSPAKVTTTTGTQTNSPAKMYSFGGYSFPVMPSSFKVVSKNKSGAAGSPEVAYSNQNSLGDIEQDIESVCKEHNYSLELGSANMWTTETKTENGKPPQTDYAGSCDTKTNQWQFDISLDSSKANTYNVSILSGPVISAPGPMQ